MHLFAELVSFTLLTASGVLLYVPQLAHLLRGGAADGLSLPSLVSGSVNYLAWNVYLLREDATLLLVANVLASLVWYAVTALAVRRLPLTRACLLPAAWTVVLVGTVVAAPELLAVMLAIGSLVTYVPQAVAAWTAPTLAGLAPATWVIAVVQGAAWVVAAVPDGLLGGAVFGLVSAATAVSVLLAVVVRRPRVTTGLLPDAAMGPDDVTLTA